MDRFHVRSCHAHHDSPSSSETSNTSVMVSGTFSLCFSVTVWQDGTTHKIGSNAIILQTGADLVVNVLWWWWRSPLWPPSACPPRRCSPASEQYPAPCYRSGQQKHRAWHVCPRMFIRMMQCVLTYHSSSIWLGTVLQQYINDVCVSLLGRLVKGCVSILKREGWKGVIFLRVAVY